MKLEIKKTCGYLLIILFCTKIISAQEIPYSQNYTISEYKADNQNWDICMAENGKMYVANNKGLLEYDGLNWNLWEMPNKTVVRSVLAHNNKIYVGSFEEFGFWERSANGTLVYTSLVATMEVAQTLSAEEFWQIINYKDTIIFRSFAGIYQYKDGEISHYEIGNTILSCDVIGDDLYVSSLGRGIFKLSAKGLEQFLFSELLVDVKIISIVAIVPDQLFISTALSGCFIQNKGKITPWKSAINSILKKQLLNRFSKLENGNMVFGTIKNGVYLTDALGNILYNINRESGLLNNTVLGQFIGSNNDLWLGLDNGITSIDISAPYYFFNDITGNIGAVYDVINYNGTIYIGSNTGLFYIDKKKKLQFISESQGQVWDLQEIDGALFCGHNNGTFLVEGNTIKRISPYTGGYVIKRIPEQKNKYIQGTYSGLVVYNKDKNKWRSIHLGNRLKPLKYLAFENPHVVWAAHAYKGLYKIVLDERYEKIIDYKDYSDKGLWSSYNVRVYNFNNTITFYTEKGWQKYEPLLDSIVPHDILNDRIGNKGYIISEDNLKSLALKTDDVISINRDLINQKNVTIPNKYYKERLVSGNENISKLGDSLIVLNLFNGYMVINPHKVSKNDSLQQPSFERVSIDGAFIKLDTLAIELPFKNNNISFRVACPKSKNANFQYSLLNDAIDPTWSEFNNGNLELSNLSYGKFKLEVRTIDANGNISKSSYFSFTVLPPLYKSKIAQLIYLTILILALVLFYILYRRKITKEKRRILLKYEESQKKVLEEKALENEKAIIRLRNDSLRSEVKLKSKQLANTAMAVVKKNEVLLNLKKEILLNKEGFSNINSFKKILKQIDYSIEHEDEWEVFESNFNQVHDEFFNQLTTRFSNLSNRDLKICAYIKMNLLNKEIAPLLNISVRGVETQRYRLKRKLMLENDENLTYFMRNFGSVI